LKDVRVASQESVFLAKQNVPSKLKTSMKLFYERRRTEGRVDA
jgi:hypothetical protein